MYTSFTTKIAIERSEFDINYQTPIVFFGSCFSDNIGGILKRLKFPVLQNPFGVLYNPTSVAQSIRRIINKNKLSSTDLIEHNKLWHSFAFHSKFSDSNADKVIENTNNTIMHSNAFLNTSKYLIITFGTAWVFQNKEDNQVVSNCHKIPAGKFNRYRLSVSEIVKEWNDLIDEIHEFNPQIKIIFTVSPIRHLKDGAHENQISKSTLFLAIDEIMKLNKNVKLSYFPSFEIINDELRDYRHFSDDMIHISNKAIQYIFERFKDKYFSETTSVCSDEINNLIQSLEHRILIKNREEINSFSESMLKKISLIEKKYPYINFKLENDYFKNLYTIQ